MTRFGRTKRLAAILTAGTIAVLVPTVPVQAQDLGYPAPPPVDIGLAPQPAEPEPDETYTKESECVKAGEARGEGVLAEGSWGQRHLRLDEASLIATGEGQTVAVIDTGVNDHNFLTKEVIGAGDFVDKQANGREDCDGHGTEVAGIIAGNPPGGQNIGFRGVAPNAQIMSIRQTSQSYVVDKEGAENDGNTAGNTKTLAQAVVRAAEQGATVINISVDSCRKAGPIQPDERILQAAVRKAVDQWDAVVVAAAGNTSENCPQNNQDDVNKPQSIVTPPWFAEDVLSVAAIDEQGSVAEFSMNGPWVSLAAPGTNIVSLDPADPGQLANRQAEAGQDPQPIQGTSFAAPYVAGVAALVRERFPDLKAREVMNRLKTTAQHPGAPGGRDAFTGHGVVNPIAALTAIVPEEEGIQRAQPQQLPADLPEPSQKDWVPIAIAIGGTGGALAILGITMFVLHAIRRHRGEPKQPRGFA
ncbi:membrane-anchored mycosin MYCP [Tamaricihabitans halophyticus]|uniref:Membrane-anchored mycosin MYCP n=1 Tax=Tamaricihabitans halophyticus TaxID=1262583 RepID=A0A4R2QTH7_9PSEU|nr:type VII secretion-associated serine protease mycosin [Tamaricihabitans halophyticus]TCP53240.1 membrane-anchored mycosin MYCP [Tamaricihabitans halophyticus]